jgi:hypothetical protein
LADEGLAQCVSNGCEYRNRQNKINAAAAAPAAAAATIATFNLANTSNITNTSISTFASTLINGNEITASFELTSPPSSDPSTTSSLPPLRCLLHVRMHPIHPWLVPNRQNLG